MDAEERFINLETQLAFAQDEVTQLSQVLAQKDRRLMELESRVERLERAIQALSSKVDAGPDEVEGTRPEEDPVPRSG